MKKIVSFEKELDFPSMIGEIMSISLDHTLQFTDNSSASGEFIVSGTYKMTEASTIEEKFNYPIPALITLTEKLDLDSAKITINDFSYEIVNDDILKCTIDVMVEGTEEIDLEEKEEVLEEKEEKEELEIEEIIRDDQVRECDGSPKEEKEIEVEEIIETNNEIVMPEAELTSHNSAVIEKIDKEESEYDMTNKEEKTVDKLETSTNISSLFQVFENSEETFTTYSVYIVRKEDTLDKILDQYKVTKEELSDYNDLSNIEIGSKLIIPTCND